MKHVVVTGASAGIGAAIARAFAERGSKLTLIARRRDLLEKLAAELSVETHIVVCDLVRLDTVTSWIDEAEAKLGPIDVLVNNAGIQPVSPTAKADLDFCEDTLTVNLTAPMRLIRTILPRMLERQSGTIVNVSSVAALAPTPGMFYYNAAKAGIAAASEALAGELRLTPIRVVTVYPGIIAETDMAQRSLQKYEPSRAVALQPIGTAAGVAKRVVAAVEKGRRRVIYPQMNALARHFPALTRWTMDLFTPALRS
jgi:short-subunit dehydrogenase